MGKEIWFCQVQGGQGCGGSGAALRGGLALGYPFEG